MHQAPVVGWMPDCYGGNQDDARAKSFTRIIVLATTAVLWGGSMTHFTDEETKVQSN